LLGFALLALLFEAFAHICCILLLLASLYSINNSKRKEPTTTTMSSSILSEEQQKAENEMIIWQAICQLPEESEERKEREQAFAQRNASLALMTAVKNGTVKLTEHTLLGKRGDFLKAPPGAPKKKAKMKNPALIRKALSFEPADEPADDVPKKSTTTTSTTAVDKKIAELATTTTTAVDKTIAELATTTTTTTVDKKIAELEEEARVAAEATQKALKEQTAYVEQTDPAVRCYSSTMHHLHNILMGFDETNNNNNKILLSLRDMHDKFEAEYKSASEIFEREFRCKIRASNAAKEAQNKSEDTLRSAKAIRDLAEKLAFVSAKRGA